MHYHRLTGYFNAGALALAARGIEGLVCNNGHMRPLVEDEAIEHKWLTRGIECAQRRVERRNFDARKELLEFDDVANDQRHYIYRQRDELMEADDIADAIGQMHGDVVAELVAEHMPPESIDDQWDIDGLRQALQTEFDVNLPVREWLDEDENLDDQGVCERRGSSVFIKT